MKNCIYYIALLFVLMRSLPASAEVTLFVSPNGEGAFIIEADNINDTPYLEISVRYDSNILSNPRVSLQGGTVTDVFDAIPGSLNFTAFRGDNPNSSFEAHLDFDKKGEFQGGGIISVNSSTREPDGTSSPSRSMLNIPIQTPVPSPIPERSSPLEAKSGSSEGCNPHLQQEGCKEELSHELKKGHGIDTVPSLEPLTQEVDNTASKEDSAQAFISSKIPPKYYKSVLQRFIEFSGQKSLQAFTALFERNSGRAPEQEPSVVLSDGKTPVRIRLELQSKAENSPNIDLSDAKLVQLLKDGEKGWIVTVLPKTGTWNASVVITTEIEHIEIPLIVAPAITFRKNITEKNFITELGKFISDQGAGGKREPDPFHSIPYDYVFTANYLAGLEPHPAVMPEQATLVSKTKK